MPRCCEAGAINGLPQLHRGHNGSVRVPPRPRPGSAESESEFESVGRDGPRPAPLWSVLSCTPWKWRSRPPSTRGFEIRIVGITARRSRPKVWTDPGLMAVLLAPFTPSGEQVSDSNLMANTAFAAVAYERGYRGDEILQGKDRVGGRFRLGELALLGEPIEAVERPGQDAGQLRRSAPASRTCSRYRGSSWSW